MNKCVVCNEIIPEGRQVCPNCSFEIVESVMNKKKKKYKISCNGCHDTTECEFEFTKDEFYFLDDVFKKFNKEAKYSCMPKIEFEEVREKE